jgi:hypothetical protein
LLNSRPRQRAVNQLPLLDTSSTSYSYSYLFQALVLLIVTTFGVICLYYCILRPLLYATVFRSGLLLLRRGLFPEPFFIEEDEEAGEQYQKKAVFLNADLEESSPDEAIFVWSLIVDATGRLVEHHVLPARK